MKILALIKTIFQTFINWYVSKPVAIKPTIVGVYPSDTELMKKAVKAFELKKQGAAG